MTTDPLPGNRVSLEAFFKLRDNGTTVSREIVGGCATFMTMAYIIFVNPAILAGAGMPFPSVAAATCLGAMIPTLLMGLWANYPFALASGMGLNAALVMHATQPGMTWQKMMGVIVIEGCIITALVLTRTREQVMNAIPLNLKRAIGVGIGIFIAFLGLQEMGWIAKGPGLVFAIHGDLAARPTLIATAGVLLIATLLSHRVHGAILIGILGTTVLAVVTDFVKPGAKAIVQAPEKWVALPDFSTVFQADIAGAFTPALSGVIFAFLITDFFDTMGTIIGVGDQGGFVNKDGHLPRLNRVLMVDSLAAVWGGLCGASSVTSYIESAAGVSAGGRTGLVSVVVALLFGLALFFGPIIGMVPAVATAPALLIVGYLMMNVVKEMEFHTIEDGIPAFLTMLLIPMAQSISFGIGIGFIAHVLLRALRGKTRELSPWMYAIAILFVVSFVWGL